MEYTQLGSTGITIPRLCIGGMSFGRVFPDVHQWVIDQEATRAVIARALELGVNFIDTANVYAHGIGYNCIFTSQHTANGHTHSCMHVGHDGKMVKQEGQRGKVLNLLHSLSIYATSPYLHEPVVYYFCFHCYIYLMCYVADMFF